MPWKNWCPRMLALDEKNHAKCRRRNILSCSQFRLLVLTWSHNIATQCPCVESRDVNRRLMLMAGTTNLAIDSLSSWRRSWALDDVKSQEEPRERPANAKPRSSELFHPNGSLSRLDRSGSKTPWASRYNKHAVRISYSLHYTSPSLLQEPHSFVQAAVP